MSILTVSDLNSAVAASLERNFPMVQVSGEVSQFVCAASGHWYFGLRDSQASVRSVMFKGRSAALGWQPKDGDRVVVTAAVTLYEPRGDFQLRVESISRAGQGALYEAFLALKEKLTKEGLLDDSRKRGLPETIHSVGLVTSLSAAALRDVVVTLTRQAPRLKIRLYPSLVQGSEAPAALIYQLRCACADPAVDVVILARGGGSLEDLWAFNDENLCREIARAAKVVVVGVGHETDVTLADLVADIRCATPTAAAQLIAQTDEEKASALFTLMDRLRLSVQRRWELAQQSLDLLSRQLRSPKMQWQERQHQLSSVFSRLAFAAKGLAQESKSRLAGLSASLIALDPTAILQRGYAIVTDGAGKPVMDADAVRDGELLSAQLAKGLVDVRVEKPDVTKRSR